MRSVKTTAYDQNNNKLCNDIFTSLRCKKVQGIVQSVSESLSIKWNRRFRGLTMFVFSISALDRSSKALSWVGSSFSISSAIPFSKHHFFQSGDQKAVLFTVFSLFKLFFSRGGERNYLKCRPLFRSQIFKSSNFVATSRARI